MILFTRSPVRISYAGGGSDYQSFFKEYEGSVVSATIDKYVYFISLPQWPLAEDRFRFTYRQTESVKDLSELQHPVVRELLRDLAWNDPINMATMADVPGQSGLGSSSAFTAAAIQNLAYRTGQKISGNELARRTIHLERMVLGEPGGWQDQAATASGGFRSYTFQGNDFQSHDISLTLDDQSYLESRQILVATKFERSHSQVAEEVELKAGNVYRSTMEESARIAKHLSVSIANSKSIEITYQALVNAVKEHWNQKRQIPMNAIFTSTLNTKLLMLKELQVDAAKLLGSGDGGYILALAKPSVINEIEESFGKSNCIRFKYSHTGTSTQEFKA